MVYIAIVVIVIVFVTLSMVQMTKPIVHLSNTQRVNEVGEYVMDRIVRELRRGVVIDSFSAGNTAITYKIPLTFAERVKKDGAVAHWNFEETTGSTLVDKIGSVHGTIYNDPEQGSTAVVGNGYVFDGGSDGSKDYVQLPNNVFNAHNQGAVEVIAKLDSTATNINSIFAFALGSGPQPTILHTTFKSINGNMRPAMYKTAEVIGNNSDYLLDTFYHIVYDYVSPNTNKIYVNGVEVPLTLNATTGGWFNAASNNGSQYYGIGVKVTGTTPGSLYEAFKGTVDELALYSTFTGSHDAAFWKNHYDAAWGIDNENNVKQMSISYDTNSNRVKFIDDGSESYLSNEKVKISALTLTPIVRDSTNIGAQIVISVVAGEGTPAEVSKTFQTAVMLRNPTI